ncbi:crotonase/enoyl-CoA hydratase family protein [Spongiibacter nanhainus]|uniref:Crotonase/enoyl-CoA hydratase family protein n=1 Tax=Spongiibacter nanhainus TaxID=2794344 RepID=A0A7T4R400_9GAMM|nr:crotonase/enoyl-CoA hydratase family protein [Spongiibacter nanhainus]QQD19934.1 crotonase/enoyl-CoA hydratase family protein [Spongiibacter nanhainus]
MTYQLNNKVAIAAFDDGKVNAVNEAFIDQLNQYLDDAERDAGALIITGRPGMFSAGFDLKALQGDEQAAARLVQRGMAMLVRLYEYPLPLIAACSGHAIGLGAFILLASDNRIGSAGSYQITLPETALSMPFTPVLLTLINDRVSSSHQTRTALQSSPLSPESAVTAGFLDLVAAPDELLTTAQTMAEKLAELPQAAYAANKRDLRAQSLAAMRTSL